VNARRAERRLEAIEEVLDGLRERGPDVVVLVEGDRDVEALRGLGVPGPIMKLNLGESLLNLCESLARRYPTVIVMTDWDSKGNELASKVTSLLEGTVARVDLGPRDRLDRLLRPEVREVEAIDSLVARLRRAVGTEARRPS
jgi:5S rRNA maturation endonuclease (ribonuclease M5)